jgi:hypothetical protein
VIGDASLGSASESSSFSASVLSSSEPKIELFSVISALHEQEYLHEQHLVVQLEAH